MNGDGLADLLTTGIWGIEPGVLLLGDPECSLRFSQRISRFGSPGISFDMGDFDGDGIGDVMVAARDDLVFFRGSVDGIQWVPSSSIRTEGYGRIQDNDGGSCTFLGDVDRDGYGDFAVGERAFGRGIGLVHVLFGNPEGRLVARVQTLRRSSFPLGASAR